MYWLIAGSASAIKQWPLWLVMSGPRPPASNGQAAKTHRREVNNMGQRHIGRNDHHHFSCLLRCDKARGVAPLVVSVAVVVQGARGGIDRVEVSASNGQLVRALPARFTFLHPGQHSIQAVVVDGLGRTATAVPVMVEVTEWPEELGLRVLGEIGTYIPVTDARPVPLRIERIKNTTNRGRRTSAPD